MSPGQPPQNPYEPPREAAQLYAPVYQAGNIEHFKLLKQFRQQIHALGGFLDIHRQRRHAPLRRVARHRWRCPGAERRKGHPDGDYRRSRTHLALCRSCRLPQAALGFVCRAGAQLFVRAWQPGQSECLRPDYSGSRHPTSPPSARIRVAVAGARHSLDDSPRTIDDAGGRSSRTMADLIPALSPLSLSHVLDRRPHPCL